MVEFKVRVTCSCPPLLELQLGDVAERFQASGGVNITFALLFGIVVAAGINPWVAEGNADPVVPYVSMHDTTLLRPLLKQTVPIAEKEKHSESR